MRRRDDGVTLIDATGAAQNFDHVVIAAHADQALRMLDDPTPSERECLGAFRYGANHAVLHTDAQRDAEDRRAAWASWNYTSLHRGRRAPAFA